MSETFPVMTRNAEILSHLESVGRLLRRGALYCIDVDRQDGLEGGAVASRSGAGARYRAATRSVEVREYQPPDAVGLGIHSIFELECNIRFPDRHGRHARPVPVRYTMPSLLELAAQSARGYFAMVACYADLSFIKPIEKCYGRWLGVLRRV